jgi:threonine dehydrogenase-like Zn-dependent dehydrogenase
MRACTVAPGRPDTAGVEDIAAPPADAGDVLVEGLLVGVCGTDVEITSAGYGWPPPGHERLVLFHESFGRVVEAPADSGFVPGDLVAGIVRRPDPVPCLPCSQDHWDFCRNGQYTERGIKEIDGFGAEQWRAPAKYVVKLDQAVGDLGVLTEPTSVVAKAWDYTERLGARAPWQPQRVLVTGAGPIGLLAAMIGVQKGLEVHVLDRVTDGLKPQLVAELGATYHTEAACDLGLQPDIAIECTGVGSVVFDLMSCLAPDGVLCLTGISSGKHALDVDESSINKQLVLTNGVAFGSVNAGRRHYEQAAEYLKAADPAWLKQLITRRVPMQDWPKALERSPDDVKVVVDLQAG